MRGLLYEFLAETRLTVYRRLDITRRAGDSSHLKSNTKTAGKKKSRRPRTTVLSTMKITFFNMNASQSMLVSLL